MRKSWVALCLGTCALAAAASCGDATSNGVGNSGDGAGEAGQPAGGNGHAGTSAGSSSGGNAGTKTMGGAAGTEAGGAPGDAGQPSAGTSAGGEVSVGGETSVGGANGGEASGGIGGESAGGASSGAGGSAAGAGGTDDAGTPNCDDLKPATFDFYSELYGCGHETDTVPGGGDGWIWYDAGFYVDERTGAAWSPVLTTLSLDGATKFCDALVIGKLTDFKIPTIDEVRASFAGGCEPTEPGGTCKIHDPDHLSSAEIYQCGSCIGSATSRYCPDNTPYCSWIKTSSLCSDCAEPKGWMYGPGNGNFAAIETASALGVACVLPGLPDALP